MKHLHVNTKVLTFILFFLLLLPSCNNEEIFVVEESAIIAEETVPTEEEEDPNTEDEVPVIPINVVDDSFSTIENLPVEMVLHTNDESLPNSGTIENTSPTNGTLAANDSGTPDNPLDDIIIYTPNAGFSGSDSFEYTICDAENLTNCDTAFVTITVEANVENIATELKAFPSAYGDGANTTGGRGGIVVHVTNLNDSGAGSFRDAITMTVPRIIVFDVSGVINLSGGITIDTNNGDVTIAGQTAPEGGITFTGGRFYIKVSNFICRYIRFKGGVSVNNDSVTVTSTMVNQVWDHCSFGFGLDEGASFYYTGSNNRDCNNVTIQRCLWNENVKGSILGKNTGSPGEVPTASFIFNMFYNSGYRFPNLASNGIGQFDVINNVSWNVADRMIRGNGAFKLNHIGNYYKYGGVINDDRTNLFGFGTIPQIYNSNNKILGSAGDLTYSPAEMTADGDKSWGFFQDGGGYTYGDRLPSNYFTATQHTLLGATFTPLTADEALIDVTNDVGCNARLNADGSVSDNLDTLDANALNQVSLGNIVSKIAKTAYVVPAITSISRPAGYDTDGDGMPNTWETANGFNPNVADDNGDADNDGYTNLEEFLNVVDK